MWWHERLHVPELRLRELLLCSWMVVSTLLSLTHSLSLAIHTLTHPQPRLTHLASGSSRAYCGTGCQSAFGTCGVKSTASGTVVSPDGTCGGTNKYTCQGSPFGNCCSRNDWWWVLLSLFPPFFLPSYFSIGKDWLTRLLVVVRRRRIAPLAAGVRLRLGSAVRGQVGARRVSLWVWDRRG